MTWDQRSTGGPPPPPPWGTPPPLSFPPPPPPPPPVTAYLPPPPDPSQGWTPGGARGPLAGRWLIGCGALLLLVAIGVAIAVSSIGQLGSAAGTVIAASGGEIDGYRTEVVNGRTVLVFDAAPGIGARDGIRLGCGVVRPTLAKTVLRLEPWLLIDRAHEVIATSETPCP